MTLPACRSRRLKRSNRYRAQIGQTRAVDALMFGLDIDVPGFNLFISGPPGTGRTNRLFGFAECVADDVSRLGSARSDARHLVRPASGERSRDDRRLADRLNQQTDPDARIKALVLK